MHDEVEVFGDMSDKMIKPLANLFGVYRKIEEVFNGHVAYRHKNTRVDSYIWFSPNVGWLIGGEENCGSSSAVLHGEIFSPSPVSSLGWKILFNRKWSACGSISIASTNNTETNNFRGPSVNFGNSKEDSIELYENVANYGTPDKPVSVECYLVSVIAVLSSFITMPCRGPSAPRIQLLDLSGVTR
jgi:hypothetical protein